MAEGSPAAPASVNEKRGRTKAIDGTLLVEEEPGDVIIREGLAELVKVSQLPDIRVQRLNEMDIKPVEELTFEDIRNYSRDQLRAYCYVYGVLRKKKFEMELDMARYASYFHPNDPEYDISKYVPKEKRGDNDGDSPHANPSDPLIREPSQQQQDAATPQLDPSVQFRIPEQVGGQEQGGFKRPATIQIGQFRQHLRQSQEQRRLFDEQQKAVWEREHMQLQQAAEKFKLSFSSEESMTSKMVDDAAAFYRGHDTEEAIEDKAISWDRITRNNGILKEIFDGAEPKEQALVVEADMKSVREKMGIEKDEVGINDVEAAAEKKLVDLTTTYERLSEADPVKDRRFMKAFHTLSKASTHEELESAQKSFEEAHNIKIVESQPRVQPSDTNVSSKKPESMVLMSW